MFFNFGFKNKTVKELRKNKSFTARELALELKVNESLILRVDGRKLKDVPDPLYSRLVKVLKD